MTSNEIRQKFLSFFEKRGHVVLPSASLLPQNDPSVLFNTAGMQPLVPYLLGEEHPKGRRLANIQKCVRTNDIEEVGDSTHLTFFEMMGNWSLGDYWKKESINWSYELLTSKEEGFGLDPNRIYVTCFEGDENAPKDEESAQIWKEIFKKNGITGERIYFRPKEKNWWSAGPNGPCGPDTEIFYDLTSKLDKGLTLDEYIEADDKQNVVEIWNNVFMQYLSKDGKIIGELPNKNVDTGAGFERMVTVIQNKSNVFETDIFEDILSEIKKNIPESNEKFQRIVADHIRASVFLLAEGVMPSNKDRGYVLRRLIRRLAAIGYRLNKNFNSNKLKSTVFIVIQKYKNFYPELEKSNVFENLSLEIEKFTKTIDEGLKQFEKNTDPFILFTTYGFPIELTQELAKEKGREIDIEKFKIDFEKHQEISKRGSEIKFKGGLSGTGEMEIKYHTATHLLHQALRDILGDSVQQKGSNITPERLRFDFSFPRKITEDEKQRVEDTVNEKIKMKLPVGKVSMKKDDAEKIGALHFFGEKYPDEVTVYYIGDSLDNAYSKEFCGGPHVDNLSILGKFKIIKEEAVSVGTRRIKAILE